MRHAQKITTRAPYILHEGEVPAGEGTNPRSSKGDTRQPVPSSAHLALQCLH